MLFHYFFCNFFNLFGGFKKMLYFCCRYIDVVHNNLIKYYATPSKNSDSTTHF